MSSMDYVATWRAHPALFVGEVVRMRAGELTVDFSGRDALVRVLPTTHSYRHASLAVGAEIEGFGMARRGGLKVSLGHGAGKTLAVIDAACIQ